MNTTTISSARAGSGTVRTVLGIFKLRIGVLIMISALAGLAITPGPTIGIVQGLVLALSVLVASASAGAFNQYIEADSDRLMARTRRRAFASGALSTSPLWLVLIALLLAAAVGASALVVNPVAAGFLCLGAFTYGVVYTLWLKRRTWANIVIGGLSGSFAVLAGAAAVDPTLGALLGGAYFLRKTHALARAPSRATAMASFFASMVQLSALLAAVAVDAAIR